MSTITNDAEVTLSNEVYLFALKNCYGALSANYNIFELKNYLMIIRVLLWDEIHHHYTVNQRKFLESKLKTPLVNYNYL